VENRPTWIETFMSDAENIAKRSVIPFQVGAVLVKGRHNLLACYNGKAAGSDNIYRVGDYEADEAHAELNLICWAARYGIPTDGCSIFCTASPCLRCAIAMIQAGIVQVFCYDRPARNQEACPCGIKKLEEHRIPVRFVHEPLLSVVI